MISFSRDFLFECIFKRVFIFKEPNQKSDSRRNSNEHEETFLKGLHKKSKSFLSKNIKIGR
jgi:hypothetical protein